MLGASPSFVWELWAKLNWAVTSPPSTKQQGGSLDTLLERELCSADMRPISHAVCTLISCFPKAGLAQCRGYEGDALGAVVCVQPRHGVLTWELLSVSDGQLLTSHNSWLGCQLSKDSGWNMVCHITALLIVSSDSCFCSLLPKASIKLHFKCTRRLKTPCASKQ